MMKLELRDTQKEVIVELRRSWKEHRTHLIYGPVGMGKTAMAAYIASGFVNSGKRVLFVAPYTVLVEQTFSKFIEYGLSKPGIIWQTHPETDYARSVQIASADTLKNRELPEFDILIIDEAHLKRKHLLELIQDCDKPVIGLSGTPFADWMGNYYENLVKTTTMRRLIDLGVLCDFEFYAPTKPNLDGCRTQNTVMGSDYVETELEEVMNGADIVGDIVGNWLEHSGHEATICFCVNVNHANHVTVEFNNHGVKAEVMTANTPIVERKQIISRFEDGITKVICNVGVLVAGFDADVRCLIYARPTKSEMRWIQCLGRGLRSAKGKQFAKIFDHSGTVHRLGFPDSIEYDYLKSDKDGMDEVGQARKEKEKKEKLPKECSSCNFMKPAGVYVCPKCGFKPLVGENVEVDETRELSALKKKKVVTKEDKQSFYSQLMAIRMERSYSEGWVANQYKNKFGVWPRGLSKIAKEPSKEVRNYVKSRQIAYAKSKNK